MRTDGHNGSVNTEAGISGYPVSALQVDQEAQWELGAIDAGVARYRAGLTKKTPSGAAVPTSLADQQPGLWITSRVLPGLSAAIAEQQADVIDIIANGRSGRSPYRASFEHLWLITLLPPDTIAYLTITNCLIARLKPPLTGTVVSHLASRIMTDFGYQVEWSMYKKKNRDELKEGERNYDLARLLERATAVIDRKRIQKWRRAIEDFERVKWSHGAKCRLGAVLLNLLVENGLGFFEITDVFLQGKTQRIFRLTDAAQDEIAASHAHLELCSPHLRPMIIPPKPWRKEPSNDEV